MTMLERANAAAMDEVKRQLGLKPIPGDAGGGWSGIGDPGSLDFALIVRAVLTAVREPDENVQMAMNAQGEPGKVVHPTVARHVWEAGIDAILAGKDTP